MDSLVTMQPRSRTAALVREVAQRRGTCAATAEELAASPVGCEVASELVFWSLVAARDEDDELAEGLRVLVVRINELRDQRPGPFVVGTIRGGVVRVTAREVPA